MKAPWKPKDAIPLLSFFCPVCLCHVELAGEQDHHVEQADHLLDFHRSWLLSTHGREVISREAR